LLLGSGARGVRVDTAFVDSTARTYLMMMMIMMMMMKDVVQEHHAKL
jgi:hypothetical protein